MHMEDVAPSFKSNLSMQNFPDSYINVLEPEKLLLLCIIRVFMKKIHEISESFFEDSMYRIIFAMSTLQILNAGIGKSER